MTAEREEEISRDRPFPLSDNPVSPYAMTDYVRQKGFAAFGTRLRRLSERLDRQGQALYRAHDVGFGPRWDPVVPMLHPHGGLSVGELAALIGITHAAVSQVRGELIRNGLVRATPNKADRR